MKRIISFLLFLLTLTILQGQDNLVTIKLKNGNEITGEIIQGGPDHYYVRIMTGNKKIKDIYTQDIQKIYKANTVIEQTRDTASNIKIPVVNTEWVKPVEIRIEPAKKQVEVTDNTSGKYSVPSKTLKKITAMSSLILGVSGAYFEYSASKNYDNYKNAKTGAVSYREKVEQADDMKLKLFISSGVLMGTSAYLHIKGKKVENIQHDQPVN